MFKFRKARSPNQTLNDLDEYITGLGSEPVTWLAREVQAWGEFSYAEIEQAILDGRLNELIDWQARYAEYVNERLRPMWFAALAAAASKATRGKVTFYDSDIDVKAWLMAHGGEFITRLSEESRRAITAIILRAQGQASFNPKEIARQIRPLIGLTERQALANANYRDRILARYLEEGATLTAAQARAEKAALRYAGKQHRFRAETIVHTELSYAYNRGADMGVRAAIRQGLMGRCEMVWTTAGTNRVCPRCLALKDTVVGHTDEGGVQIPPLHPRCRCTIAYREVAEPRINQPARPTAPPQSPLGARNYDSEFAKTIGRDHYDRIRDIMEAAPNSKAAQLFAKYEDQIKVDLKTHNKRDAWHLNGQVTISLNYHSKGDSLSKPYQTVFHEVGHLIDWLRRQATNTAVYGTTTRTFYSNFSETYNNGALIKAIKADFKNILATVKKVDAVALIEEKIAAGDFDWLLCNDIITWSEYKNRKPPQKIKVPNRLAYKVLKEKWEAKYSVMDRAELSDFLSGATKNSYELGCGHPASYWKSGGEGARVREAFAEFMETAIANKAAYDVLVENLPQTAKVFEEMLDELLKG